MPIVLFGGALIDLDSTLLMQLVIFVVLFFVLRSLVFRPMVAVFEARETAIDGSREDAKRMEREAKEKADAFDAELKKIRISAQEERDRLRQDAQHLERAIMEKVRVETQKMLTDSEAQLKQESAKLRSEMSALVPNLGRDIASKLLGREAR